MVLLEVRSVHFHQRRVSPSFRLSPRTARGLCLDIALDDPLLGEVSRNNWLRTFETAIVLLLRRSHSIGTGSSDVVYSVCAHF